MEPITKPTPPETPAVNDDDFDEPLGERQPEANDAIVCEGGCQQIPTEGFDYNTPSR